MVEGVYSDKTTQVTGVVFEPQSGPRASPPNHAMENAPRINVQFADGTRTKARQVARAQCHDLAVLKLGPQAARAGLDAAGRLEPRRAWASR